MEMEGTQTFRGSRLFPALAVDAEDPEELVGAAAFTHDTTFLSTPTPSIRRPRAFLGRLVRGCFSNDVTFEHDENPVGEAKNLRQF